MTLPGVLAGVLLGVMAALPAEGLAAPPRGRATSAAQEDVARARQRRGARVAPSIAIEPWAEATFARARRERRLVLVDGAAAWCHWCHVMDETTWRDPDIVRLVGERFVFVRFDVDERPDLGDRYEATGWPATILLGPDGAELGRHKGYLPPDEALPLLRAAVERAGAPAGADAVASVEPGAPPEALPWLGRLLAHTLDDARDEVHGGWGRRKFPRPGNVLFELSRAAAGDRAALARAHAALTAHLRLVDPVWGGLWKGNAEADWSRPHVEKQLLYQGPNLEALARGYAATSDRALLEGARAIERYLATFLTSPDGGLYTAQDADVGAHDPAARFVDGAVYYTWGDARRRRAGLPWIDTHVYARDNGLALAGLAALYQAERDPAVLARARRVAAHLVARAVTADGSVEHDAARATGRFFLADAAALGLGLLRLGEASGDPALTATARRIAAAIERNFGDAATGALFDATVDEGAAGAFARRERPLDPAVWAARLFAGLARDPAQAAEAERWRRLGRRVLAAAATPAQVNAEGAVVGELLLALEELGTGESQLTGNRARAD